MLEIYFKSVRDEHFIKSADLRIGSWIHVQQATTEDLQKIAEITGIEMDDLQDSLDKYENPRIENKKDSTIIFARHPSDQEAGLYTTTMTIILTPSYFITIAPHTSQVIDNVLQRKLELGTTQKSKLLFYILLEITQNFTNHIKVVRNAVIEQEKKIKNINNAAIVMLTENEDILNQYLSTLVPMRNLLDAITSGRYVHLYEKDYNLLQDLSIAIKQSEDLCSVNVKSIRSLRDSYQILFTNDVNKTIKILTAITIIFTIPTIIASIYGMNISLPLEKNPHAFLIIMNATIVLCIISTIIFIRKRWL